MEDLCVHASAVDQHASSRSPVRRDTRLALARTPSPPVRSLFVECPALPAPDWVRRGKLRAPSIRHAVLTNNLQDVSAALDEDPFLFHRPADRRQEPILALALRRACSPHLIMLLLEHGADPNACGPDGSSALDVLAPVNFLYDFEDGSSSAHQVAAPRGFQQETTAAQVFDAHRSGEGFAECQTSEQDRCAYAAMLLAFGADARRKGKDGLTAAQRAEQQGRSRLACYLQHWSGDQVQALHCASTTLVQRAPVIRAAMGVKCFLGSVFNPRLVGSALPWAGHASLELLPDCLCENICDMLAPSISLSRVDI